MAFQDFDYISERRKNEKKEKLKKQIIIGVVVLLILLLLIGGAIWATLYANQNNAKKKDNDKAKKSPPPPSADKAIQMLCASTDYKQTCLESLSKYVKANPSATSKQPKALLQASISVIAKDLNNVYNKISKLNFDTPELKGAYEDCKVLFQDAKEELNASISNVGQQPTTNLASSTPDLNNWLSAVLSYQETCIDGFPEGKTKTDLQSALNSTKRLTSNSLAIVSQLSSLSGTINLAGANRHLLEAEAAAAATATEDGSPMSYLDDEGLPEWISTDERRILKSKDVIKLTPNVTVAKDGSGEFKTISDALAAVPETYEGRYVIYVKVGIYEEYPIVTKNMVNLTIYGDGSQKSIVTGNKNFVDGVRTFQTATFTVLGEGFMAQSIGFRNTAGAEKHQAVAIRVQADKSVFLNCRMEAYQDTLYAQTHRQFYRGCTISGTVDFIFGDAASVFQNCVINIRKPLENQQNIVTAQGRIDKHESTGIVLQGCRILAEKDFEEDKMKYKNYLGRPWKEYSRTIVMQSDIDELVDPEGWMPWEGDFALKTLYYAEYENKGAGATTNSRVKWAGYKGIITKDLAQQYTTGPFLQGNTWLGPETKVRFGLI